jgi:hypothetical protein
MLISRWQFLPLNPVGRLWHAVVPFVVRSDAEAIACADIPLGVLHLLKNPGKVPLYLIEVQSGGYLGADDIVRLEDSYNRVDAA